MKYKAIKIMTYLGMALSLCLFLYLTANFIISIYIFATKQKEIFNEITFYCIKQNNLKNQIIFSVCCVVFALLFLLSFRVNQIIKSWCEYQDYELRNDLFYKKHPTALAKIKSMYDNNPRKLTSYAKGEFQENNGIYIYNNKLEKYNVENRLERNVPLKGMLKDFILIKPFSPAYYKSQTFPQHRELEEYTVDLLEENEELEKLREN